MHIVCFNLSAISLVAQIHEVKAEIESILPFGDDLSFGPISDVIGPERELWHNYFLKSRFAFSARESEESWRMNLRRYERIRAGKGDLQVWLSRNSIGELCGFSEFLCQVPENQKFEIVDFTDFSDGISLRVSSIGQLGLDSLSRGRDQRRESEVAEWRSLTKNWKTLKAENANLRISRQHMPESIFESYYDSRLLSAVSENWASTARVISNIIINDEYRCSTPSWDALYWRLESNSQTGKLEVRSSESEPIAQIRRTKVR